MTNEELADFITQTPDWADRLGTAQTHMIVSALRAPAQCAPATGSLLEEARKRYPQTGGTHRQAFIEGAQWAAITSSAPAAQRAPDERRAFEKWLPDHLMPSEFSHGFLFQRDEDRYTICFVQDAWDGWMARAALTSTDARAPIKGSESCTCHFIGAGTHHVPGCPFYKIATAVSSTDGGGNDGSTN